MAHLLSPSQYRLTPKASQSGLPKFGALTTTLCGTYAIGILTAFTGCTVSIDGEHAPYEPFQVEVHPGLGRVLSLRNDWYLPPEWTKQQSS